MRSSLPPSISTVAAALLLAACGGSPSGAGHPYGAAAGNASAATGGSTSSVDAAVTVKATANARLRLTLLVDQRGLTLYRLSGEQAGRFICTAACLKIWHPLTVASATKPVGGLSGLGVLKRPDGNQQLAYKGMPLYTFSQDQSPGQVKGQGIKDVGVWNAVSTSSSARAPAPVSSAPAYPSESRSAY